VRVTEPVLTAAQRGAVAADGAGGLVVANAGSGKTTVLVERIVRAVHTHDIPFGSLLGITFTEKAAAELSARVRRRLADLGEEELAREAERAQLSTIHRFCARLLRAHPLAAGLDPGFTVLEDLEAQRLGRAAFAQALGEWTQSHGAAAVEVAALHRVAELRQLVLSVVERRRSAGRRQPGLPPAPPPPRLAPLRRELRHAAAALTAELAARETNGPTVARALEAAVGCGELLAAGEEGDPVAPERLGGLALAAPGAAAALSSPVCDRYREALTRYRQGCVDVVAGPHYALLSDLVERQADAYDAAKRRRSALDFADLELDAVGLLETDSDLREALAERYAHVLLDEAQDSNPVQLRLLELLAGPRLYAVGDAFQSIYRFRHADPRLFAVRSARARQSGQLHELAANFRSHPALLAALNHAFAGATFREGFVALEPPPGTPSDAGTQPPLDDPAPRVELLVCDRPAWSVPDRPALGEALPGTRAWRLAEARLLAQRVAELVTGGRRPGEVVVLMRAAGDMALYERALEDAGLPTYAVGGHGYWQQTQVADVLAYLRVVANPLDGEALIHALASPFGGVGTDALVVVGEAVHTARRSRGASPAPREPWGLLEAWWDAGGIIGPPDQARAPLDPGAPLDSPAALDSGAPVDSPAALDPASPVDLQGVLFAPPGETPAGPPAPVLELTPADRGALGAFVERLRHHRRQAPRWSLEGLVERAVVDAGYDLAMLRLPGGARRLANVRKLMRLARLHEQAEGPDLRALLDRVGERQGGELDDHEGEAPVEGDGLDAIRLMTIHRAKGLEFPVVCVADLGRRRPGARDRLLVGEDGRVGLRLPSFAGSVAPAFAQAELAEAELHAEADEERRLFYVAMTRAQERLILSGAGDPARWALEPGPRAEPMAWIARAFVGDPSVLLDPDEPERTLGVGPNDAVAVRWAWNSPATVGGVLHERSLDPAGPADGVAAAGAEGFAPADGLPADGPAPAASPASPPSASVPAALPDRPEHPADRVSYSALELHDRCGYRYYLERVLGLSPVAAPPGAEPAALPASVRGTLIHALLERVQLTGRPGPALSELRTLASAHGVPLGEATAEELLATVRGFLRSPLSGRLASVRGLRREQPFSLLLDPGDASSPLVVGTLDVLARDRDGTAIVVDYKTDRLRAGEDLAVRVGRDYDLQRRIYALAGLRSGAARVEVIHCFLGRPDEPVSARFTRVDVEALTAMMGERCRKLTSSTFKVTDTPHRALCATCPGRAALCSWPPERTLAESPVTGS